MWPTVLLSSAGCYVLKLAGVSVPASLLRSRRVQAFAAALPIGLLVALSTVGTFGTGQHLVIDARAAGLAVAVISVTLRAPFLVTVVAAVITTALLRVLM